MMRFTLVTPYIIGYVLGHVLPVLSYYASKMHSASPRLAISIFGCCTNPPVCVRFAHLDCYERFSLFEAGKHVKNSEAGKGVKNSATDPPLPRSEA